MKRLSFMVGALGVLLSLAMACSGGGSNEVREAEPTTTQEDVMDAMEDAAETAGAYVEGVVGMEFETEVKAKLTTVQKGIDDLRAKASEYGAEAEEEAGQLLGPLSEKRQVIEQDLEGLKDKSGEAMEQTRSAIETAVAELERAYQDARAKLE